MSRLSAVGLLVAAMCLTGFNVPLGKVLVAEAPVYALVLFRFVLATAVLAVLARYEPGPRLADMSMRQLVDLGVLSGLGSVGYMVLSLEGVKRSSGIDAGIILATLPAVAALVGIVVRRHWPGAVQWLAIGLAVLGLLVVNLAAPPHGGDRTAAGNLLLALAVVCEASFVVVSGRISSVYGPIRLSLGVSAASLVMTLPLGLRELLALVESHPGSAFWLGAIWYALSASVFCTILWYLGAPHVEAWLAGMATAALPVAALVASVWFLGESMDHSRLIGAVLVIAAIVIGAISASSRRSSA